MNLTKWLRRRNLFACEYGGCGERNSLITQCGRHCEPCGKCGCCHPCHPLMELA